MSLAACERCWEYPCECSDNPRVRLTASALALVAAWDAYDPDDDGVSKDERFLREAEVDRCKLALIDAACAFRARKGR